MCDCCVVVCFICDCGRCILVGFDWFSGSVV